MVLICFLLWIQQIIKTNKNNKFNRKIYKVTNNNKKKINKINFFSSKDFIQNKFNMMTKEIKKKSIKIFIEISSKFRFIIRILSKI